jgi:hypothetical protein
MFEYAVRVGRELKVDLSLSKIPTFYYVLAKPRLTSLLTRLVESHKYILDPIVVLARDDVHDFALLLLVSTPTPPLSLTLLNPPTTRKIAIGGIVFRGVHKFLYATAT